jgi:iron complex outermembrane receptor protein
MALRRICGFTLAVLLPCAGQTPQSSTQALAPNGLADASLEDLMNIEVTSVSKKAQRIGSTAASVFVITSEDIRRSGITILPELLRLAPGVQVARLSSGQWSIGIRGFSDEFSNKLLVLVDGRSVYNEFLSGVVWDTLNIPVDDIERIEVIRGPGAAMWGTNAVNGVINIITKSAKDTHGGLVVAGGGSEATSNGSVRYGGQAAPGADYRVGVQNTTTDPFQIINSASPSVGWVSHSGDFRLDWDISPKDSLLVSGAIFDTSIGVMVPSGTLASPNAPPANDQISTTGGAVNVRWQHVLSDTSSIEVRFSYDHLLQKDPQLPNSTNFLNYGFQQHVQVGSRNDVIWGVTFNDGDFRVTPGPVIHFNPASGSRDELALFVEDQIALIPDKLSFIAGVQGSHVSNVGYVIQPTGRLLWTPTPILSTWVAVSRADRTPDIYERTLDLVQPPLEIPSGSPLVPPLLGIVNVTGNPATRAETVLAYEAGQRFQVAKQISFDVSTFYNVYHHLTTLETGAPVLEFSSGMPYLLIPTTFGNQFHGNSYGTEASATWSASSRWRMTGGYTWLLTNRVPYVYSTAVVSEDGPNDMTPHDQWVLRSNFDLTRKIQIDTAFYYTSATLDTAIPQHLRGDLHIDWRPNSKIELSMGVQDAFEANHLEALATRFGQTSQIPRNFYGKLTWRF